MNGFLAILNELRKFYNPHYGKPLLKLFKMKLSYLLIAISIYVHSSLGVGEPCGIGRPCSEGACLGRRGFPVDGILVKRGTCVNGLKI